MCWEFQHTCLIASWAMLVLIGCQSAEEAPSVSTATEAPIATSADQSIPEPAAPTAAHGANSAQPEGPTPEIALQFSPPFPDRVELFEPPKRAQSAVRQNDVSVTVTVVLPAVASTGPTPLISADSALRISHTRLTESPLLTDKGVAVNWLMAICSLSVLTVTRSVPTPL